MFRRWTAVRVVVLAALMGVTTVLTLLVRVPIAPTRGYIHLGDVGVYFAAFTFGPVMGLLAGGLGTAMADVLGCYAHWAPLTLVFHGVQGGVAGYLGYRATTARQALAWAVGSLIMVGGYFLAEVVLYGVGAALVEIPGNAVQALAGGLVAIPLSAALRQAWPPVETLGLVRPWEERR
ncbi:MAG: ECF transporter S component [Anaerolineae bacterium]|nr:ECF transporter S component [Anaerolineae bacterium]